MDNQYRILIAGGGTGGHLYPAIAIGETIQSKYPDSAVHFIGSKFGIEETVLPVKSLPHTLLPIRGLQRGLNFQSLARNVILPWRLFNSVRIARKVINQFKPDVIVGTGGYASAIPLKIAVKNNIPIILQEQNSYPGMTTRYFAEHAKRICIAFDAAKKYIKQDTILTGNPIRSKINIGTKKAGSLLFDLDSNTKTLFLFGGSQGSAFLNKIMAESISMFETEKVQILWQTGPNEYEKYKQFESALIKVHPFIDRMAESYSSADLIISRAGALTLSEISACGKPSILVPFPHSAGHHQRKNAEFFEKAGAAVLLPEKTLIARDFYQTTINLLYNEKKMSKMVDNSMKIGFPDATNIIVDKIIEIINTNV